MDGIRRTKIFRQIADQWMEFRQNNSIAARTKKSEFTPIYPDANNLDLKCKN
jgi:hypothetical protein